MILSDIEDAISVVKTSLKEDSIEAWNSLIINKRKPYTFRAFIKWIDRGNIKRICLHKFEPCLASEAFLHPHPWAAVFKVLEGEYVQTTGFSRTRNSTPSSDSFMSMKLAPGSTYEISQPFIWHSIQPLTTCYSIMVNESPWKYPHDFAPATKGKDLDSMSDVDLQKHLDKFRELLGE